MALTGTVPVPPLCSGKELMTTPVPSPDPPGPAARGRLALRLRLRLTAPTRRLRPDSRRLAVRPTTPPPWPPAPAGWAPGDRRRRAQRPVRHRRLRPRPSTSRSRCTPRTSSPTRCRRSATSSPSTSKRVHRPRLRHPHLRRRHRQGGRARQAAGADPSSYGGTDLVAQLEKTVADSGPGEGRVQDVLDAEADRRRLRERGRPGVRRRGAHRRAQPGGGRGHHVPARPAVPRRAGSGSGFTQDTRAPDQTCDADKASKPDLDATAFAVQALQRGRLRRRPRRGGPAVDVAEGRSRRRTARSAAAAAGTPNTQQHRPGRRRPRRGGRDAAAEKAATWVVRHQALDCQEFDPAASGAIAYDDAGLAAAAKKGIPVKTEDQFRRASAERAAGAAVAARRARPRASRSGPAEVSRRGGAVRRAVVAVVVTATVALPARRAPASAPTAAARPGTG